jgi:hypothetical protein
MVHFLISNIVLLRFHICDSTIGEFIKYLARPNMWEGLRGDAGGIVEYDISMEFRTVLHLPCQRVLSANFKNP